MKTIQVWHGRLATGVALAALVVGLSGCAWSIGGKEQGGETMQTPTRGQELIDLKKALEQGALTEEEYDRLRAEVIDR